MICKKLMAQTFLVGPILGAILFAVLVVGCAGDSGLGEGPGSDRTTATQGVSEREGGDSGGAHGGRREGSGDSGEHGSGGESGSEHTGGGGEEGSGANTLAPDETFDAVRGGARLILNYDAPSNSFKGTVENTTNGVLTSVRIEVHLSNGTELGPTTPIDMAPGDVEMVNLPSTQASFTGWVAHAEVGSQGSESGGEGGGEHGRKGEGSGDEGSESGGEGGGEHGGKGEGSGGEGGESGGEGGGESGGKGEGSGGEGGESGGEGGGTGSDGGGESREAAMSSPIIPLGQSWNGVLGGLAVSMQYDAATLTVHGTVRNTLSQKLCYVQAEPHLKSGTKTVGELGPEKLGHLNPGQEATSSLMVASEPELARVSYDGYVVHMEVFDCSGPGPAAHTGGEGSEGNGEHGSGDEGGDESSTDVSEEGRGGNALAQDETFDAVRGGARLILSYDAPSNSFKGTVENTTNGVLDRVRIEVHLSNGAELGPTTPTDMAPGEVLDINLPATPASFTGWTAHAEVGSGDEGSESGGEHGGDRESGGEHGSGGERRGGG